MNRLAGIDAKLDRGERILAQVGAEWDAWMATEPVSWVSGFDSGKGIFIVVMVMREAPPTVIALLASEFVHHVRSSLDHLACYLVEASGSHITTHIAWPVLKSRKAWKKNVVQSERSMLDGASRTALAFVESKQPYRDSGGVQEHPLVMLHDLWNLDKHQMLSATPLYVRPPDWRSLIHVDPESEPIEFRWVIDSDSVLQEKALIAWMRFPIGQPLPKIVMDGRLPVTIGIGDGAGVEVRLDDTVETVRAIVNEARALSLP